MTSTEYALQILNDTDYGKGLGATDSEVISKWSEEDKRELCTDYLEFITSINGASELHRWERDMARHFKIELEDRIGAN